MSCGTRPGKSCEDVRAQRGLSRPPCARGTLGRCGHQPWERAPAPHPTAHLTADARPPTSPAGAGKCCGAPGAHLCGRRGGARHRGPRPPCTRHRWDGGPAQLRSQSRPGLLSRSSCGAAGTCNPDGPSCAGPVAAPPPPRRGASHFRSASCSTKGRGGTVRAPTPPPPRRPQGGLCVLPHLSRHQAGAPLSEDGGSGQRGLLVRVKGTCWNETQSFPSPSSSYFPLPPDCVSPLPLGLSKAGGGGGRTQLRTHSGSDEASRERATRGEGLRGHLGFPDLREHWLNRWSSLRLTTHAGPLKPFQELTSNCLWDRAQRTSVQTPRARSRGEGQETGTGVRNPKPSM